MGAEMNIKSISLTLFLGLAALSPSANAALVINIVEQGTGVVATGFGSADTTDLAGPLSFGNGTGIFPQIARVSLGFPNGTYAFFGISGPSNFGFGSSSDGVASTGSGNTFGVIGEFSEIYFPLYYVSGTPLSATNTWDNTTLSGLGLTPGTYVYTWGTGDHADSLTVQVGAVPEPSTWAMMILGFVGLGWMAYRRKNNRVLSAA
jgi:hypothetical protein